MNRLLTPTRLHAAASAQRLTARSRPGAGRRLAWGRGVVSAAAGCRGQVKIAEITAVFAPESVGGVLPSFRPVPMSCFLDSDRAPDTYRTDARFLTDGFSGNGFDLRNYQVQPGSPGA